MTLPALKPAVAVGGIDCETVVLAVWAAAMATRADATESVESIMMSFVCERWRGLEESGVMVERLQHEQVLM